MVESASNPNSVSAPESSKGVLAWLRSDKGKIAGAVVLLLIAAGVFYSTFGGQDPSQTTKYRLMIDSETSKTFKVRIVDGDRFPLSNPETGQRTLYPVEVCNWTRDGKATMDPTYVFVKEYAGINEKTYCPDCGREVRRHNPSPPEKLMIEAAEAKYPNK